MSNKKHFGLIMAGGQGTRFWPWSTAEKPKQFLSIVGDQPLITQTFNRLSKCMPAENIFIVADKRYLAQVKEAIPQFKEENYVAEPCPKNTAPCIMLANIALSRIDEDANVAVVPADHYIPDTEIYAQQVHEALNMADERFIVTSGIKPDMPHTGYGYIQFDTDRSTAPEKTEFFDVVQFKEKPELAVAKDYVSMGNYYWNAGMFFYNLKHFKSFLKEYNDYYYQEYLKLEKSYDSPQDFISCFTSIKPESIDYALMERVKEVKMFKAAYSWSDVGAWSSVYELNAKDQDQNVSNKSKQVFIDSQNSMIFSTRETPIAIVGLKDVVVINTENGILISHIDELQKVKQVKDKLAQ